MPDAEPVPHLLTIDQLAEHLGVTQRHVRRLVAEKRVPYLKWRRFIRFDPAEIVEWLDGSRHSQRADAAPLARMAPTAADPDA